MNPENDSPPSDGVIHEIVVTLISDYPDEVSALFHLCCPTGFSLQETLTGPPDMARPYQILTYVEREGELPLALDRIEQTVRRLEREGRLEKPGIIDCHAIPNEDWRLSWRKHFKILRPVPGLVVRPSWESPAAGPDELEIVIEPGAGFGVGSHPTTNLALKALADMDLEDKSLLDVGTGSGILAMYGRMRGTDPALGIDIDAEAIENALQNLELNPAAGGVAFETADFTAFDAGGGYDVVAANLTENLHLENLDRLHRATKPGGRTIMTGILAIAQERMTRRIGEKFKILDILQGGEWICFLAEPLRID